LNAALNVYDFRKRKVCRKHKTAARDDGKITAGG
jgi:hypothetical protein